MWMRAVRVSVREEVVLEWGLPGMVLQTQEQSGSNRPLPPVLVCVSAKLTFSQGFESK